MRRRVPWCQARSAVALAAAIVLLVVAASPSSARFPTAAGSTGRRAQLTVAGIPVFPASGLEPGMVGRGLTVVRGTTVESFGVRILGVQPDGIAPGIDFILVELFGGVIERTGGAAAGMSGSPVYIGDRLVGAIAYGFFGGDFRVAGVTPAEPMLEILEYPSRLPRLASTWPERVDLSPETYRLAREVAGGDGQMRQLTLPLSVSGLNGRGMQVLRRSIASANLPFIAYSGGASGPHRRGRAVDPLPPGSSYSAVLSYGDLTLAGVGTTTARVGRKSVGFGHPFFFTGPTRFGLNGGRVLTVVKNLFVPFKFALVGPPHGMLTQDRLAGVAGVAGRFPELTTVRARLENLDLRVRRSGATRIAQEFQFLPDLAFFALLVEVDRTFDRIGEGSARYTWTIRGTRARGGEFGFRRSNMFDSDFDTGIESLLEPLGNLFAIHAFRLEPVRITSVRLVGDITQEHRILEVDSVSVRSTSSPTPSEGFVQARPGDTLTIEVRLRPPTGGPARTERLKLVVPEFAGSLQLVVRGGGAPLLQDEFLFDVPANGVPDGEPQSLNELLRQLKSAEHNNDLIAELVPGFFEEPVDGPVIGEGAGESIAREVRVLRHVVQGSVTIEVLVG